MSKSPRQSLPSPAPVERANLTSLIIERLRDYVIKHRFEIGGRLPPERELSSRLNVSRPSLRQALDWLERQGALRRVQGGGTFLLTRFLPLIDRPQNGADPPGDAHELIEACVMLETSFVSATLERRRDECLESLSACQAAAEALAENTDACREHLLRFHIEWAKAAGNVVLAGVVESLLRRLIHGEGERGSTFDVDTQLVRHRALLDALARADAEAAVDHLHSALAGLGPPSSAREAAEPRRTSAR